MPGQMAFSVIGASFSLAKSPRRQDRRDRFRLDLIPAAARTQELGMQRVCGPLANETACYKADRTIQLILDLLAAARN
jgi:hypothetical protein